MYTQELYIYAYQNHSSMSFKVFKVSVFFIWEVQPCWRRDTHFRPVSGDKQRSKNLFYSVPGDGHVYHVVSQWLAERPQFCRTVSQKTRFKEFNELYHVQLDPFMLLSYISKMSNYKYCFWNLVWGTNTKWCNIMRYNRCVFSLIMIQLFTLRQSITFVAQRKKDKFMSLLAPILYLSKLKITRKFHSTSWLCTTLCWFLNIPNINISVCGRSVAVENFNGV